MIKNIIWLFLILVISCSKKENHNINENINDEISINNNIIKDMSLEDAIKEYDGNIGMDIITNLLAVSINNTLKESTNIVNIEDTEYDISITFDEGTTPLMIASYYGYYNLVNALIENNADVNLKNKRNYTALLYATDIWSRQGIGIDDSNFNVVELLVNAKIDINASNNYGWTAIFYAAYNNNSDIVAFLVDNGANINLVTEEGITPLLLARDVESVRVLAKTENINKANFEGNTPLIIYSIGYDAPLESINILLENGANINQVNKDGETALSWFY